MHQKKLNYYSPYIGTSKNEQLKMLEKIGCSSFLDLFKEIPDELLNKENIDIEGPFSEMELNNFLSGYQKKIKLIKFQLFLEEELANFTFLPF